MSYLFKGTLTNTMWDAFIHIETCKIQSAAENGFQAKTIVTSFHGQPSLFAMEIRANDKWKKLHSFYPPLYLLTPKIMANHTRGLHMRIFLLIHVNTLI